MSDSMDTFGQRMLVFIMNILAAQHVSALDGVFLEISFVGKYISNASLSTRLMIIPGTSISLFIVTLPTCQVNTSITLDDEGPTIHSFHQTKTTYNVQLYSSVPLPFGNHSIQVDLLDSINGADDTSCLFFDYAAINDTLDGTSYSTTLAATPTPPTNQHVS